MIRAFLSIAAGLAFVALAQAASPQDYKEALVSQGTLTVGTSGSAPPFSMTTPVGDLDGFDIEVASKLGEALGLEVEFEKLDFAGLLPGLASGRFDVIASGVTRTPERLASTDFFLLSPYIVNGVAVTRRAGEDAITGWDTVCGKVMGAVRGGTFQKIAMEKLPADCIASTREYPGATELFLDLRNGRIDFAAHDFLGPNYLLKSGQIEDIEVLDDLLATITQSVAVSSANKPLADAIDARFATWREDGTLQAMIEKWFGAYIDWSAAN